VRVDEHTIQVAGSPVFYRRAASSGTPILYLHGAPTSSDDWTEALARTGGLAPDLHGFGRSGKAGNLDYSIDGLAGFVEVLLSELGIDRVMLVAHDWGAAAGLAFAARHPARVQRAALLNPLPLGEGFHWRGLARALRTPIVGELVMGSVNNRLLARSLRRASAGADAWPQARIDAIWGQFDQGTQRAIIRLHRSTDDAHVLAAGEQLRELTVPTLVIWGERDPWQATEVARRWAERLPDAHFEPVADAGHWPWLDQPELIERVSAFLSTKRSA
jgi:pimeloyl-ACP methyl ester carboxylesterase